MPIDQAAILQSLDSIFKRTGWKNVYGHYYRYINDETMAYFSPFFKGEILRVQYSIAIKILNRVAWDLRGITPSFGTPKQQIANSSRCFLWWTSDALEIVEHKGDEPTAAMIAEACLRNAEPLDSIAKINAFLEAMPHELANHAADDRLCVALAQDDVLTAMKIIEREEKENVAFVFSIFAHAKRALGSR